MTTIYLLWHVRETEYGDAENAFIGAYSSEDNAKQAIERLKSQPGFKDYPDDFQIHECILDQTGWQEGFITVAEAMKPLK